MVKKNSILNCTFTMSSSFGFRSFFRNKAAVCKVGDQSLENNQPSGEPIVELLRNKMNVIGTAQEYKSPAVCLLHMEKIYCGYFYHLISWKYYDECKICEISNYDGVSCRLRRPDHNSRYKKYVDGMLVRV